MALIFDILQMWSLNYGSFKRKSNNYGMEIPYDFSAVIIYDRLGGLFD